LFFLFSLRLTPYALRSLIDLRPDPLVRKDLQQDSVFYPAIDDVGFFHTLLQGL
jgi:hypothetical protein